MWILRSGVGKEEKRQMPVSIDAQGHTQRRETNNDDQWNENVCFGMQVNVFNI